MTSSFTTTYANTILDTAFKNETVYGALFLANPGDTGSCTCEVANAYCYSRKAITFASSSSSRSIASTAELAFDAATGGNWGTITHLGIATCSTIANASLIAYGSLTAQKEIDAGDQLKFATGNISITIAAGA